MNIVQNPDGSISIIDDEIDQVKDISDITYERSEIPQYLIDECNELSNNNDKGFKITFIQAKCIPFLNEVGSKLAPIKSVSKLYNAILNYLKN